MKDSMKTKNTEENEALKCITFKVKDCAGIPIVEAMREYSNYYNSLSQFINSKLTTMTIGEIASQLPESCRKEEYYKCMVSEEWVNELAYKMFVKPFPSMFCNNIWFNYIKGISPENYTGNILGLSNTAYRRFGYFASVMGNYKTKFSSETVKVKRKKLSSNPTAEELTEQCAYEYLTNKLMAKKDWQEELKYLKERGEEKKNELSRKKVLYDFYKDNEEAVEDYINLKRVESIVAFGGCVRKDDKMSMSITFPSSSVYEVKLNDGKNGYEIDLHKGLRFSVYGNRMCLVNGEQIIDIVEKHGDSITFTIRGNDIYAGIPVYFPFEKIDNDGEGKTVGIDVNLKHAMFATSEKDNGKLKGYVNIYSELLKDAEFVNVCPKEYLKYIKEVSKYVFFAPIELEMLMSRTMKQKGYEHVGNYEALYKAENAYLNVLEKLQKQFIDEGEVYKRIYVENLKKMRAQLKAYFTLKDAYRKFQKEYDEKMGFVDIITETEKIMDPRRSEYPFRNTEIASDILGKMSNVAKTVEACRNNIIVYIYKVFEANGYSTISLEMLESAQMKKQKRIPTIDSILSYHHVKGHTIDEVKEMSIYNVTKRGVYNFEMNDKGEIVGAELTDKGNVEIIESEFYNMALKAVHFADAKDYFVVLSNNGSVNVALVPPQFTSQMDSVNHAILVKKEGKKKNTVMLEKCEARPTQEKHINGLNGDYNAARNIAYAFENKELRDTLLIKQKDSNAYGVALYYTKLKSTAGVFKKLKSFGDKYIFDVENLSTSEAKAF